MLISDLEHLQPINQSRWVEGGANTYAEANADASSDFAEANSLAFAEGDDVIIKTRTSVAFSTVGHVSSSFASAGAFAFARTGQKYSIAVDYEVDTEVSVNR